MIIPQTDACSVPNSATPVSPQKIADSQSFLNTVNNIIAKANADFTQLTDRKDLNAVGQQGTTMLPFDNTPIPHSSVIRLEVTPPICANTTRSNAVPTPRGCNIVTGKAAPIRDITRLTLAPVGVPAPAPQPVQAPKQQTTGNPCMDLQKGYIAQSQLTTQMLDQCSEKRYYQAGLKPAPIDIIKAQIAGVLPKIPDQNVPEYDQATMGLAGFGEDVTSGFGWAVGAAAAGVALAVLGKYYHKEIAGWLRW